MKLYLASTSPRRREILNNIGTIFEIFSPPEDAEQPIPEKYNGAAEGLAVVNAELKAKFSAQFLPEDSIILSADTIVVINGKILGKPSQEHTAQEMLQLLSGRVHQVITGVAVKNNKTGFLYAKAEFTDVFFKELSNEEIARYIATGEPNDKAGAYAIQGFAAPFIKKIDGCYFNVVGLPVFTTVQLLKKAYPHADQFFKV